MPLGRQSAYRLQCVPANRTWHKRSHGSSWSWSHKLSRVLILSWFLSAHTPCHKGRKWAKDERKRSTLNTIYLPSSHHPLTTPTSNPHVFNYNYAILIPKHALHDRKPDHVQAQLGSELALTNFSGQGLLALKRRKMMNEIRRYSMTTTPVQRQVRPHTSPPTPGRTHTSLQHAHFELWLSISGGINGGMFAVIYAHKSVCQPSHRMTTIRPGIPHRRRGQPSAKY